MTAAPFDLLAWRTALGWTQVRAARELCMTLTNLRELERGRRRIMPRVERLAGYVGEAEREARRLYPNVKST